MRGKFKYFFVGLLVSGGLLSVRFGIDQVEDFFSPQPEASSHIAEKKIVLIPGGASVSSIAEVLSQNQILKNPYAFKWTAYLSGSTKKLKAGEYELPLHGNLLQVFHKIKKGDTYHRKFTVYAGHSVAQVLESLKETEGLTGEIKNIPYEGTLLPKTYYFSYGSTRQELVDRIQREMFKSIDTLWQARDLNLPIKTPKEALILASIVEKESASKEEYPRIAGIMINRLKKRMRLQSDPTVIYGLRRGVKLERGLSKKDLKRKTPYNTYTKYGLPPTPISNPSQGAIEAVMKPMVTKELYFVADGQGGHAFATTYKQHRKNHKKWRKIRKTLRPE